MFKPPSNSGPQTTLCAKQQLIISATTGRHEYLKPFKCGH